MEIISFGELGKRCGIDADKLRVYLGNYTFNPFIKSARGANNRRCLGVELSDEFKLAFKDYLIKRRNLKFAKRTLRLLEEYEKYKEKLK